MTNFDLTAALQARVAGQEVDLLRIANQTVWQKPSASPSHYSLFTTETPANQFLDGPLTVATLFYSSVAGTVDAVRYFAPNQSQLGRKGGLWQMNSDTDGFQVGPTIALNTTDDNTWNVENFPAPISILANQRYAISVYYPQYYVATPGFFATGPGSAGITNGPLTSPPTGALGNGRFRQPAADLVFPLSSFQGGFYFVDVVFTPNRNIRLRTALWTPPSTDNGNTEHNLGWDFQADTAITANGLWWWHDGFTPPPSVRAQLWNSSHSLVADSGTVLTSGFTASAWNFIPFASQFACSANATYSVSVYSTGSYRYSSSDLSVDQVDASGHVRALAHSGRFLNAAGAGFPTTTWDGMFGVDLGYSIP